MPEKRADAAGGSSFRDWLPPLVSIALLFLLAGPQLDRYNVTWDEALGDFFWGERYLSFFTTFDGRYLDPAIDPYPADHRPDLRSSPFRDRPWEYYPFANLLAAATSRILSGGLGLVDSFDGFHAVNLWLGALLVLALHRFVRRRWGGIAAVLAPALLLLSPRVVCHLLANIKDFPEMVLFSLASFAFLWAWERARTGAMAAAGVVWGLALATKANALFLPGVVILVVLVAELPAGWRGRGDRRLWLSLLLWAGVGGAVMVLLWPWLWPSPISRFLLHLDYVSGQVFQVREESLLSPLFAIGATTPPLTLLFSLVGLAVLAGQARARQRGAVLVLAWIAIVLARLHLPGAVNFDGVRHFLELFPALATAAAVGVGASISWLRRVRWLGADDVAFRRRATDAVVATLLVGSVIGSSAWATLATHPHQIAYWNWFVGGTRGAHERGIPQAGDYWGTSYRLGLEWLNQHLEPGSVLAVPVLQHAVVLVAPERLRADIGVAPITVPNFPEMDPRAMEFLRATAIERPVYVMFVLREDWMNELMRDCLTRLDPLVEWRLDGVALLQIYRFLPDTSR